MIDGRSHWKQHSHFCLHSVYYQCSHDSAGSHFHRQTSPAAVVYLRCPHHGCLPIYASRSNGQLWSLRSRGAAWLTYCDLEGYQSPSIQSAHCLFIFVHCIIRTYMGVSQIFQLLSIRRLIYLIYRPLGWLVDNQTRLR